MTDAERIRVAIEQLRALRRRLVAVHDPYYRVTDRVQGVIDLAVSVDLPFLVDFLDSGRTAEGEGVDR